LPDASSPFLKTGRREKFFATLFVTAGFEPCLFALGMRQSTDIGGQYAFSLPGTLRHL